MAIRTPAFNALNLPPLRIFSNTTGGIALTNPLIQETGNVNNFTQSATQNLSSGVNSSADHICYPNNNVDDATGFIDIGITSSGYAQAAYSVTGPNEAYVFGSAPAASGKSGDMVFATDSSGTTNAMRWYTSGFAQLIGAYAMKLTGTGLLQVCKGLSQMSKLIVANGAATAYTVPAATSYVYLGTSAASMAMTIPAAGAAIDGFLLTVCPSAAVAAVTWTSAGATFAGAPAAFVANTPARMIYDHASLIWYPA